MVQGGQDRAAVVKAGLLQAGPEERFARISRVLAAVLDVPIAFVSLIDDRRQHYKGALGVASPEVPVPLEETFCAETVVSGRLLVVPDLAADERFRDMRYVRENGYRFYAGQPLCIDGDVVGTLCGIDVAPRELPARQRDLMADLAAWAEAELVKVELIDVLDRERRAAAQLAVEQRRGELVLQFADQPLYGLDCDGIISFANPAGGRLLREDPARLVGVHFHDNYHHTRPDGSPFPWQECPTHDVLMQGVRRRRTGDVLHARDGTRVEVECSAAPVIVDEEVVGAVVSFTDVGRRRAVERMKDEFVSVVSHELRTPLTSVRGSLGLLASGRFGELPAQAVRLVEIALTNTERLVRLVNDMLDLERIEAGKLELNTVVAPLAPVLEAARDGVVGLAEEAGVDVLVSGGHVVGVYDRDLLVRALLNLVGNSVKFTERGGRVELAAFAAGAEVHVDVRDNGRGIPRDRLTRIFERFEQVDVSDRRDKGGTGLGLAITRSIVERHGGRVAVRSEPGVGSTFTISLPAPGAADVGAATLQVQG